METDIDFILALLGAKEVENAQLRRQIIELQQQLRAANAVKVKETSESPVK